MKLRATQWIIGAASAAGFAIMAYLTYIHYAKIGSFCDFSSGVSCDIVTSSIYSEIFGIPVSFLGMIYFSLAAYFAFAKSDYLKIILFTLVSIFPSLYLSIAEVFFIKSICILCETSKVLIFIILGASFIELKYSGRKISSDAIITCVILGLLAVGMMYFVNSTGLF